LKTFSWDEIEEITQNSDKKYIVVDNYVIDVTDFIPEHPGGPILNDFIGKDATQSYNKLHDHTKAARLMLDSKKVGIIKSGVEG